MNILAINTTSKLGEVVCCGGKKVEKEKIDSSFSEKIMPSIMNVLEKTDVLVKDIDVFGVVTGPGSFTGIRIGMAVIKGMMSALDAKCVAVNSFELVSYNIDSSDFIVLLDSGNSEHYYSIFKNKKIEELGHNNIETIKDFAQKNGLKIYYSSAETNVFGGYDFLTKVEAQENTLLELIKKNAEKGEFADLKTLSPVYIKMSQAEIGLEQDIKQNMTFRVASVQDANALSIIDEQCFDGYEKYSEESFVQELTLADRHYIVACHKNLVVGYVGLWKTGDDLNLIKIAVLPQFRKLGIGFKLMNMSADYRANGGFDKYFLEVREGNENAIKLYKKFGFKTANTREKYYSDGENCLVMFAK